MEQPIKTRLEPSINCFNLVKECEGKFLNAYLCPAGVWTISWGVTKYANGQSVKQGDRLTEEQCLGELGYALRKVAANISIMIRQPLNQNQVDALISFVYNIGEPRFERSTVLRLLNLNPNDPKIADAFRMWRYGGDGQHNGKDDDGDGIIDEPGEKQFLPGLAKRREKEIELYFKDPVSAIMPAQQN